LDRISASAQICTNCRRLRIIGAFINTVGEDILIRVPFRFIEQTHAFENSPKFTLTDAQCNDAEKKKSLMNLLNNAVFFDNGNSKEAFEYFLKVNDSDLKDIQGSPFNAFDGVQQKRIKAEFKNQFAADTDNFYMSIFSKEDIDTLDAELKKLNKKDRNTLDFKKMAIKTVGSVAKSICDKYSDMDDKGKSKVMNALCKSLLHSFPQIPLSGEINTAVRIAYTESLLENGAITVDNIDVFQKYGIDPKKGMVIINNSDFGEKLKNDIKDISGSVKIKQYLTREVDEFLKKNAQSLKMLKTGSYVTEKNVQISNKQNNTVTYDLRQNVINATVITKRISELLQSEQPQSPELLLNEFLHLNSQVKDLSGKDATRILDDIININITSRPIGDGLEFIDEEEVLGSLKKNRDNFENVIRNLHASAKDPKNKPIASFLNETAVLVEAFYNRCIINASAEHNFVLDPETTDKKYKGVFLDTTMGIPEPPPLDAINGAQNQKSNELNRNASKMELIVAEHMLKTGEKYKDLAQIYKDRVVNLMYKTSCDNLDLLVAIADEPATYENFIEGFKTLRIPGDSAYHHLYEFYDFGKGIKQVSEKTGIDIESIRSIFIDSIIASNSREDLEAFYTELTDPRNVTEYEIMNTLSTKEMYVLAEQGIAKGAKNMAEVYEKASNKSAERIQISLDFADNLKKGLEKALNKNSTGALFNYSNQVSFEKIPYDDLYHKELNNRFPNTVKEIDISILANKVPVSDAEKTTFVNFFNNLKIPGGKTVGELSTGESFEIKYKSIDKGPANRDNILSAFLGLPTLTFLYAPYAKEISELCRQNNNNPSPQQIWSLIHGGNAPADLTADNLNEKLLISLCSQYEAYGKMTGVRAQPETMHIYFVNSGIPIFRYFEKMKDIATNDVTFSFDDQTSSEGLFSMLNNHGYTHGEDNYGFGLDFHRSRLPYGANDPQKTREEQDGTTITVVNNNETVTFSRKEQLAHEDKNVSDPMHPYITKMVKHIDGLCKSKEQLAMVGVLTTQSTNNALLTLDSYYRDVAGEVKEHAANDFLITKEGDNINVKITSKPGAKYTYSVEYVVTPDGSSTIKEGTFTLPKVSTEIKKGEEPFT